VPGGAPPICGRMPGNGGPPGIPLGVAGAPAVGALGPVGLPTLTSACCGRMPCCGGTAAPNGGGAPPPFDKAPMAGGNTCPNGTSRDAFATLVATDKGLQGSVTSLDAFATLVATDNGLLESTASLAASPWPEKLWPTSFD